MNVGQAQIASAGEPLPCLRLTASSWFLRTLLATAALASLTSLRAVLASPYRSPLDLSRGYAYTIVFACLVAGSIALAFGLGSAVWMRVSGRSRRELPPPMPVGAGIGAGVMAGSQVLVKLLVETGGSPAWGATVALVAGGSVGYLVFRLVGAIEPLARPLPWMGVIAVCAAVFAILVWSAGADLAHAEASGMRASARPNVLLISLDTLRRDRLGAYGSQRSLTPAMDALARGSLVYEDAVAPVAFTGPSHTTMLTGLYPFRHGAVENQVPMRSGMESLPRILAAEGYATGAFVSSRVLSAEWSGLDRHFERYDDDRSCWEAIPDLAIEEGIGRALAGGLHMLTGRRLVCLRRPGERTLTRALEWIGETRSRPFFAFVHLYDVHGPYGQAPQPFRTRYVSTPAASRIVPERFQRGSTADRAAVRRVGDWTEQMEGFYDGGVAYADHLIGEFLDELRARGLDRRTLLILTADHGESMTEHDYYFGHGDFLYQTTIGVPLLLRFPDGYRAGSRVTELARLADLTPTVLTYLGARVPEGLDGSVLPGLPYPSANQPARVAYGCVRLGHDSRRVTRHYVRRGGLKLIWNFDARLEFGARPVLEELYDLRSDPGETSNLLPEASGTAGELRGLLRAWVEMRKVPEAPVPSLEARNDLRSLGYLN